MPSETIQESFYKLEKTYPVTMSEQDKNYCLKPSSLLNLLQDMGARNISGTPFGNKELNAKNLGWFLVRYRLEFEKYPSHLTEITLKTENRGTLRQTAYRQFEGYNNSGDRLLRAFTSWMMVDLDSKSLVNIEQEFPEIIKFEKREDDLAFKKLRALETYDDEKTFHVRYEDLDMNGHVNNTVYMTWALEALDYDFRANNSIKSIDIYYKHEVRYGEDIISCVKFDRENNATDHLIKKESGEEVCLIRVEYI